MKICNSRSFIWQRCTFYIDEYCCDRNNYTPKLENTWRDILRGTKGAHVEVV
jgi:hypothetical protein